MAISGWSLDGESHRFPSVHRLPPHTFQSVCFFQAGPEAVADQLVIVSNQGY